MRAWTVFAFGTIGRYKVLNKTEMFSVPRKLSQKLLISKQLVFYA